MNDFQIAWLVTAIVLLIFLMWLGVWIVKKPWGILIDSRNKMSLSRLQVVLWSWLLISAFLAVAIVHNTMKIEMAPQIWALMGISVGSVAGSVIVKGTKAGQVPSDEALDRAKTLERAAATARASALPEGAERTAALEAAGAATVTALGVLDVNTTPKEATFANLFEGEELTNHSYVDISKVQMFFFTLATVIGYALILVDYKFVADPQTGVVHFPDLSSSLVTLLGISHAGYLTVKAAPKAPTV